ncbi:MAG: T9SS type A sorting domain-containing protein [Saprospiraceae bacterium]|jgi:hypothetical protein|nr:T9SS type A sorting domain-containing protein [Saprospiraceae bacterium]
MSNLFSKLLLAALVVCPMQMLWAQAKLNLSLMPDQRTYLVSMVPEKTWAPPQNTVASIQVVLQLQAGKPFLAGQINSMIPGITWADNAYVESPSAASGQQFVCFVMNERSTNKIPFDAGVETPLFTFVNLEPGCAGLVQLVEKNDAVVRDVVLRDRINVTQNMTVLGARGNAVTGILNQGADCTVLSTSGSTPALVNNLRVFPVPATNFLNIAWENAAANGPDKLLVSDMLGKVMTLENTSDLTGEHRMQLDIATYPTGLYTAVLTNTSGERQVFRFVVIHP